MDIILCIAELQFRTHLKEPFESGTGVPRYITAIVFRIRIRRILEDLIGFSKRDVILLNP